MIAEERNCYSKKTGVPGQAYSFCSVTGKMASTYPMSVRRESFGLEAVAVG